MKTTKQETFTERLRRFIAESELTRYELAKQSGVSQSALSRFVSGERGLTTETLDKLTVALGLELVKGRRKPGAKKER